MEHEVKVQQGSFEGKVKGCQKIGIDISSGKFYLIDNTGSWKEFQASAIGGGGGSILSRFGIEDATGVQDRSVDMGGFGLSLTNVSRFRAFTPEGNGVFVNNGIDGSVSLEVDSVDSDNGGQSIFTLGDPESIGKSCIIGSASDNTNNSFVLIAPTFIRFRLGGYDPDADIRIIELASGAYTGVTKYIPLTVNGNVADAAGDVPVSLQSVLDKNNIVIDGKGFSLRDSTASQHVTVSDLVNSGWIKDIVIDQPTVSIQFRNGNSDNNFSSIQRLGNNQAEFRLTSKNATDGSSSPIAGFITHYCYNTSNAAILKQQIGKPTNDSIGVLNSISSGAGDPSTSDIPSGFSAIWKNTLTGDIKLWVNNSGTMVASIALS